MGNVTATRAPTPDCVHQELAPLHEACAAAYHVLIEAQSAAASAEDTAEARGLIAIALSRVATLYRRRDGSFSPLSEREIRESLFSGAPRPDLDGLYIRRSTLLRAMETLKALQLL
jgi:hypothetical protein